MKDDNDLIQCGNFYYDFGTRNYSFIKISKILKDLRVKNNMFMLKLFDNRVANLDPYEVELTDKEKILIIEECRKNFWYFIREVIRVPVPGGLRRFEIHRGNLAELWCLLHNLNTYIILPRQNFKTVSACSFYLWVFLFGTTNSEMSLMHKKYEDSKNNLKRIKDLRELLPEYLQINDPKDNTNVTFLYNRTNKNKIIAFGAATSEEMGDVIGRGCTQPIQYYDEFAFLKYNQGATCSPF